MIDVRLRQHFHASADSVPFDLDIEFSSAAGVTVLFGPSGAGKTLTLDSIAGFFCPREGRVEVAGTVLYDAARNVNLSPQKRQCGYVFQNYALFPNRTLRDNIAFAAERLPRLERHRRVNEMLERFRLTEFAGRKPHELSGGQKQRCSIARALLAAPRVLLLDEPARGLDIPLRQEFYAVLRQVRAEFATPVLLVTHDLDECFELGDEMLVFREGHIVQNGPPRKVIDQPANLDVARLLGLYNVLPVEIKTLDPSRNSSVLRFGEWELEGPYFPGRFRGDRVSLIVRPEYLRAYPLDGRPGRNQVSVSLLRARERPESTRLEFSESITVVLPRADYERYKHNKEWVVEFPSPFLRIL
ncbi:MAG: ABC transporter ATP-binding protein [Bryobacterales bacterium]|nr:ABC transporter ATP-binding protein [Bryobacterales bacterium]